MLQPWIEETAQSLNQIRQQDLPLLQQSCNWQDKYRILMQLGKKLPLLPDMLRQDTFLLNGCDSKTWLLHHFDSTTQRHFFLIDSEARIVKGLCAVVLSLVNGKSSTELAATPFKEEYAGLQLQHSMSQSRSNGINQLMSHLQQLFSSTYVQP